MKFELWVNGRRQEQTFESRDAADAEAGKLRGKDGSMSFVVCVAGAGRVEGGSVVVDRDMDRFRGAHANPVQAVSFPGTGGGEPSTFVVNVGSGGGGGEGAPKPPAVTAGAGGTSKSSK